MNTENSVLMGQAKEALSGKWGLAIGTFVVYLLITMGIQIIPKAGFIVSFLISAPLALGISMFSLNLARGKEAKLEQMFDGFKHFGTAFVAYLLMVVYIVLWALLLIIPGIIAGLSYAQTFNIIADDPSIRPIDALNKSKAMMDGHKMKLFVLGLMFFGLALLCILTVGIGFFFLYPFMSVTLAKFYIDIKGEEDTYSSPTADQMLDQV
jgi:uncharacterized membrane protein